MASMPFFSFRFLQNKNLKIPTAGLHAGHFVKLQELQYPCHLLAVGFCKAKTQDSIEPASGPAGLCCKEIDCTTPLCGWYIRPCGPVLQGN
jgi:hypothetical protein